MDTKIAEQRKEAGGAEPGTPGAAPPGSSALHAEPERKRRNYTSVERLEMVTSYQREGGRVEDFAARRGVSSPSLRNWLKAFAVGGAAALEPKPNRRNQGGRSRGQYSPDERRAIVEAFQRSGLGQREFARTWGVAQKSLSTWLERFHEQGPKGLESRPYTPRGNDPRRLSDAVRAEITRTQERFPTFGMRKVRDFLKRFAGISVSAGSIRKTLSEARIEPLPMPRKRPKRKPMPPRRFERAKPGQMWQSDITSFLLTRHSTRVYLTVFLDDCSRYVVSFALATHQRQELVTETLMEGISRFGKPEEVLTDQGRQYFSWRGKSDFQKILDREGIKHVVSRAHHPETLGKCERLWETINRELWERTRPQDLADARDRLAHWFAHYNHFRPHQGIDGLVPADRFFDAEAQVRKTLESHLAANELALALGQAPRKPVFLFGQIGDQAVSLHGERGRLVLQTSDGERKEVGLDEIGMPRSGEEKSDERADGDGGVDGSGRVGTAEAHAALQEACAFSASQTDRAGEGALGISERGGTSAGAQDVHADDRVLARSKDESGDGGDPRSAAPACVAVESIGSLGHAGRPLEATQGEEARSGSDVGNERIERAAQGDCAPLEGEPRAQDRERAFEGSTAEPPIDIEERVEGVGAGEKSGAHQDSTERRERLWDGDSLSTDDCLAECWAAWLERST